MKQKQLNRNRLLYMVLVVVTMLLGILSRKVEGLSILIGAYAGDTLWAMMVFLGLAFLFKRKSTVWIALGALIFSFGIEVSQLYHAPWIDAIRATTLGGLILGYGFLWSDLACYTVGVILGSLLDCGVGMIGSKK
ncbi:MAG: DUF2809 domain-containing protein [Candidatus Niameybacter stercoravium]|nr:DUF2809 domain-containing protein [Candidatus Niameybacter stercoravium]